MKYIATVTKGLERIAQDELVQIPQVEVVTARSKFIVFQYDGNIEYLASLKCVDDIGVLIGTMDMDRFMETGLSEYMEQISQALVFISGERALDQRFSITVSRYKNHTYSEDEIKAHVSLYLAKMLKYEFTPLDHTHLDIRLNVQENECSISIKLFPISLYKRKNLYQTREGSLRSTVASAMVSLSTEGLQKQKIVDSFCGSGTILCEALQLGHDVFGGDIDREAVMMTRSNLGKLTKAEQQIYQMDASRTRWKDNYFDIAISNYPWGKQIKVESIRKMIEGSICEYHRILKQRSRIAFLTKDHQILRKYLGKYFEIKKVDVYPIGYLGQAPTLIVADISKL